MVQWRNSGERFGAVAQGLHWGIFVLIVYQMIGALLIDAFPRESTGRQFMLDAHESVGLATLLVVLARVAWRFVDPGPPGFGPPWQQRLARFGHGALYALLLAVPMVGYFVACARGHAPAFFGLDLPSFVDRDRNLARTIKEVHEVLAWTLVALVAAHAAVALWHHLVAGEGVLRRMLPLRRRKADLGFHL